MMLLYMFSELSLLVYSRSKEKTEHRPLYIVAITFEVHRLVSFGAHNLKSILIAFFIYSPLKLSTC